MPSLWRLLFAILMLSMPFTAPALAAHAPGDMELDIETDATKCLESGDSLHAPEKIRPYFKDLLFTGRLTYQDTTVRYPGFIDFCMRVYRWYTRTFSTYDPMYVQGLKKHGKLRLVSDNWANAYYFRTRKGIPIVMGSNPYSNLGFAINYYSLSYGYSWDITSIFHGAEANHHKQSLSFSASRLYADAFMWKNSGSAELREIGNSEGARLYQKDFDGIDFKAYGVNAYYIFNYSRFCFGAAYNLSHRQLKSQGSWMLGFSLSYIDCLIDFTKLTAVNLTKLNPPQEQYRFFYDTLSVSGGYSYNLVLGKHWLYNITLLPSIGITGSKDESSTGKMTLQGLQIKGKTALNYISDKFFISITGDGLGNFFLSKSLKYISGIFNLQVSTGFKF